MILKAKYIGDPGENEEFVAYGVTFEKGKFEEVPARYEAKFAGNRFFETQGEPTSTQAKLSLNNTK